MIFCLTNQKGGVCKTTTTFCLAGALNLMNIKVLVIDLDIQGNCSHSMNGDDSKPTIIDVLTDKCQIKDAIQTTPYGDLITGGQELATTYYNLDAVKQLTQLKIKLESIKAEYEYILIDTPPSLSTITLGALNAAERIIVPVTPDNYALEGAMQLNQSIQGVRESLNPNLKIEGILVCRYKAGTSSSKFWTQKFGEFAGILKTKVFETRIRDTVAWTDAQRQGLSVYEYKNGANICAEDYANFVKELING